MTVPYSYNPTARFPGIGLATAKILALRGAKISIADVSEANLKAASAAIKEYAPQSEDVLTRKVDVRKFEEVQGWIKDTVEKFGRLDGAANIAGTVGTNYSGYTLADEDEEQWDLILGVNLTVGTDLIDGSGVTDFM